MDHKHLKKFTSIHNVQSHDVLEILDNWENSRLSEKDVFCFAEDLYYLGEWGWPQYPREDKRSIMFAVLEALSMIYTQPTLKADIPALKHFLQLEQEDPLEAWKFLDVYWESVDWTTRLEERSTQNSLPQAGDE